MLNTIGTVADGRIPLALFDSFTITNVMVIYFDGVAGSCDEGHWYASAFELIPGPDDYTDDAGRSIDTDFSTDSFDARVSFDPCQSTPTITFSYTSLKRMPHRNPLDGIACCDTHPGERVRCF